MKTLRRKVRNLTLHGELLVILEMCTRWLTAPVPLFIAPKVNDLGTCNVADALGSSAIRLPSVH